MARQIRPISTSQFRVKIAEFPETYFNSFSGVNPTREISKVPSPNSRNKVLIAGLQEFGEVTLSKPFENDSTDRQLLKLVERCADDKFSVSIQAVRNCPDETPIGPLMTLVGCVCTGVQGPEADRDGSDASMLELTIEHENINYQ